MSTSDKKLAGKKLPQSEGAKPVLYALEEKDGEVVKKKIPQKTFQLVGDEVLSEKLDPECWAKALATGVKTRDEALSVYAKLRAEALTEKVTIKESKAIALEERRLVAGAPESHSQSRVVWRRGFSLIWDFLFWQVLLSVSGVGLFLVLLAMGQESSWWPGILPLVVISACLQLLPVVFYGLGKLILEKITYPQALGTAAVLLVSLSAVIGIQTMTGKKSPRWLQAILHDKVETTPLIEVTELEEEF